MKKLSLLTLVLSLAGFGCTPLAHTQTTQTVSVYRGTYNSGTTYAMGNIVISSGGTYVSLTSTNVGNPPVSSPSYWQQIGSTTTTASVSIVGAQGTTLSASEYTNTIQPPLATWDAALHNCRNQVANVLIFGDSRSIVDTTVEPGAASGLSVTFPNRWVNRLKAKLAASCGLQALFVPFKFGAGVQLFNFDYYSSVSGTFTTDSAIGPYQGGNVPDAMNIKATSALTVTFNPGVVFDHVTMACATGSGFNAWTISVGGTQYGTCGGSSGSTTAVFATSSYVPNGTATTPITLACATSPCEAYGAGITNGTTGVGIYNLSVGSGAAEMFALAPSTQEAYSDLIPGGHQLDIIYEIANEPGVGYSTGTFATSLGNIITHERALSSAPSVLLISPLQDGISGQTSYYPVLSTAASTYSTAYFDLRDRWGASLVSSLFGPDTFHENNAGNGEVESAVEQTVLTALPAPSSFAASNCGAGYAHSVALTLPASVVSGSADLANFVWDLPFNGAGVNSLTLTALKTTANSGDVQTPNATDVIFCSAQAGGYQLPHELEAGTYVASSGAGVWHVAPPVTGHITGTTIWMFIGSPGAPDTSQPSTLWNNAGYAAVYHFGTSSTLSTADATGNANTLTNYSATAGSGELGGAAVMTSSEYMNAATPYYVPTGSANPRTMEAWVKLASSTVSGAAVLFGYGNNSASQPFAVLATSSAAGVWDEVGTYGSASYSPNTNWTHYAFVLPSGQTTIGGTLFYLNGALQTGSCITGSTNCTTALATADSNLQINGVPSTAAIDGVAETVDELRISSVARSAGWLGTQYAIQSNAASTLTLGTLY